MSKREVLFKAVLDAEEDLRRALASKHSTIEILSASNALHYAVADWAEADLTGGD